MNKKQLLACNLLQEIDIIFADYFCQSGINTEETWLLAALVSFFTNLKNTAFSPKEWANKNLYSLPINLNEDVPKYLTFPDFTNFNYQQLSHLQKEMMPYEFSCFYIRSFREDEAFIANFIKEHLQTSPINLLHLKEKIDLSFDNFCPDQSINYQKIAAIIALKSNFTIISGGPGTGKTTTVGKILTLLLSENKDLQIELLAPTGKAADRLKESIQAFKNNPNNQKLGEEINHIPTKTSTIHNFLQKLSFQQSSCDVLLIDEASMVAASLFAKLFKKIHPQCKIILLGDKNQLESIENGDVLNDLTSLPNINAFSAKVAQEIKNLTTLEVQTETTPHLLQDAIVQLTYSHRFNSESGIGQLSKIINNATSQNDPEFASIWDKFSNVLFWIKDSQNQKIINEISLEMRPYVNAVKKHLLEKAFEELTKIRILCVIRKGALGIEQINMQLEHKLFGKQNQNFYHGKPIIVTQNDHALNINNGDVGIVWQENAHSQPQIYFQTETGFKMINPLLLNEHYETAFALSIHKSQGSEFNQIFIIIPEQMNPIMNKTLLYTGVTRAKESCKIYDSNSLLPEIMITETHRISNISQRLTTD